MKLQSVSYSVSQSGAQLHSQSVNCSISHSVSQSGTQAHSQSVSCSISHSVSQVGMFIQSFCQQVRYQIAQSVGCSIIQCLGSVSCSVSQSKWLVE